MLVGLFAALFFNFCKGLQKNLLSTDVFEERRILEIVFLNCTPDELTLVPKIKMPFDALAEAHDAKDSSGGGD